MSKAQHKEGPDRSPLGPRVFALALGARTLVYAPLHKVAWLLEGAVEALDEAALVSVVAGSEEPASAVPRCGAPLSPPFLGIVPTRDCNLSCRYCAFGRGRHRERLDPDEALAALDWFARLCAREGRQRLEVELFGGEPLLEAELVHALARRTWLHARSLQMEPVLRVLTNGVAPLPVTQMVADLFDKVVVSLDGPADLHDRQRPRPGGGSCHEAVLRSARVYAQGQASLSLRCCVAAGSTHRMLDCARFFLQECRPDEVSFEPLQCSPEALRAGFAEPEPEAFVRGYLAAAALLESEGVRTVHATASLQRLALSSCPVARDGAIFGPPARAGEGASVAACYLLPRDWRRRGLEMEYASFSARVGLRLDAERLEAIRALHLGNKPRCWSCFARWHCAGACHVADTWPGCSPELSGRCRITRMLVFAQLLERLDLDAERAAFAAAPWDLESRVLAAPGLA